MNRRQRIVEDADITAVARSSCSSTCIAPFSVTMLSSAIVVASLWV